MLAAVSSAAFGQFDPPANYYSTATGTGTTLKSQLHNIIDNHTVIGYSSNREELRDLDQDPTDPSRFVLVYNRQSLPNSTSNSNWNREHTWPRGRGVDSSGPDNADLHQLRSSNISVNSDRGSLNFGGSFGQSFGQVGSFWYPGEEDAGNIARAQFYMAVRYDGSDSSTIDLELSTGNPSLSSDSLGDLNSLIDWHFAVPPDTFEQRRNDRVFDLYQGNRNPFVDHPEWAWSVIMDQQNDTRLALQGGTTAGNGSSSLDFNYGAVLVGTPMPGPESVTITETGNDGTYYSVTPTGDATSSIIGRLNAFRPNRTGSQAITVGLDANTSVAGEYTGTVTIDNLDITTGGGAGRGANDGDDTIDLSLTVLNHAAPSFSPSSAVTTLDIDLGSVELGANAASAALTLANVANNPSFQAALDVIEITGEGDTDRFGLSLTPATGPGALPAGLTRQFFAGMLTDQLGEFSVTYTIATADQDLPGRAFTDLTLTLTGEVIPAPLSADFNNDGVVDTADYTVWRDGFSTGDLTLSDYQAWRDEFGMSQPAAAAAPTPEPGSTFLLATLLAAGATLDSRGKKMAQ